MMTDEMHNASNTSTRILIVDDHELVRNGIRALLLEIPGFDVVGEACNGQEAVSCARELRPDVILMDLAMPVMDGIEATRQITNSRRECAVLVLTATTTDKNVLPAIKAGASGYLVKDSSTPELIRAIRRVARGEASIDSAFARTLLSEVTRQGEHARAPETLTERELDVLRAVAAGLNNQAIADRLVITERTVRSHMSHVLAKLQLTSRTQAALYAVREGLVDRDEDGPEGQDHLVLTRSGTKPARRPA